MKKIASVAGWMAALMVACCPCTAEMSVQDGHVYGQKEIDGKRIVYDFDVPEEVESVKQYRTEAVRMKLGWDKSSSHTFRSRVPATLGI